MDNIIYFIAYFGWCLVLLLCLYKVGLALWYKPNKPSFIFKSFFRLYLNQAFVSNRELANKNWPRFKKVHNVVTITTYGLFALWVIFFLLVTLVNK